MSDKDKPDLRVLEFTPPPKEEAAKQPLDLTKFLSNAAKTMNERKDNGKFDTTAVMVLFLDQHDDDFRISAICRGMKYSVAVAALDVTKCLFLNKLTERP